MYVKACRLHFIQHHLSLLLNHRLAQDELNEMNFSSSVLCDSENLALYSDNWVTGVNYCCYYCRRMWRGDVFIMFVFLSVCPLGL